VTRPGRKPTPAGHITKGQARILTEYARGGSCADVAARLGLALSTVKNHLHLAGRRLGATSTVHLLALAITAGDIDPDCADGTAVPR
jgi:DNA-binding CsgD family transcriptional regulator